MSHTQQISKREKLDMLAWNRRLSKAGMGTARATYRGPVAVIQPDTALEYLRAYRLRKDRTANGYRTENKFSDETLRETTTFWVQDTRSGEKVTDPAILEAVIAVVNDRSKWPYVDLSYRRGAVVFDKPGPNPLEHHSLGLPCACSRCKPEPETQSPVDNIERLRLLDESNARRGWGTF